MQTLGEGWHPLALWPPSCSATLLYCQSLGGLKFIKYIYKKKIIIKPQILTEHMKKNAHHSIVYDFLDVKNEKLPRMLCYA